MLVELAHQQLIYNAPMEGENKQQPTELKSFFSADKQRYSFYFDLAADKTPEKVDVYLEARTVTEEALLIAIDECNARLHKSGVELAREVSLYKVRLVGRNFKPKTDMPCLSLFQKICDLKITEIAVQIPSREKAIRQLVQAEKQEKKQASELTEAIKKIQLSQKVGQDHPIKI